MKLALVFLAVLPLVLSRPPEKKIFLDFLNLDNLVDRIKTIYHCDAGHDMCVLICQKIAGPMVPLCGTACIAVIADC